MNNSNNAFGAFLASRRARITPEQVGLRAGSNRRVPGLRRIEVAALAGISVEYLARLERGAVTGVSDAVLDALVQALQLDDAERDHLIHLAQIIGGGLPSRRQQKQGHVIKESVRLVLESIVTVPATIRNGRADIVAANELGRALYSEMYVQPGRPVNHGRFIFLDHRARRFYPDWDKVADGIVALLRTEAGRNPYDRELSDLIGELSTRSDEFRIRWATQNVRRHFTGDKHFHHPVVGDLRLNFESLSIDSTEGLSLTLYPPSPGTAQEDAIRLLAAWQATSDGVPASIDR